jgi:hypothetical protein
VTDEDVLESRQIAQEGHSKRCPRLSDLWPIPLWRGGKMEDAMQRIGKLPRVLILRLHLVSAMDATP